MKLVTETKEALVYELAKWEKHLLFALLKCYPRTPPGHYRLSKSGKVPDAEANQQLLEEALREQRMENQKQVAALLSEAGRFKESENGWRLKLTPGDREWLLQVLNDIRVGSWILLGCPEERPDVPILNEETAPHRWALEMAGLFEMALISTNAGEDAA